MRLLKARRDRKLSETPHIPKAMVLWEGLQSRQINEATQGSDFGVPPSPPSPAGRRRSCSASLM